MKSKGPFTRRHVVCNKVTFLLGQGMGSKAYGSVQTDTCVSNFNSDIDLNGEVSLTQRANVP